MVDAGAANSPVLLQAGSRHGWRWRCHARRHHRCSHPADQTARHDVFLRIGGLRVGKAAVSLEVNSDDVILDDIWACRGDHGSGVG